MSIFSKKKVEKGDGNEKREKSADVKVAEKKEIKEKSHKKSMKDLYSGGGGVDESKAEKSDSKKKEKFNEAYRILIKPLVTEKASGLGALNKYAFVVSGQANKILVSLAVEQVYGIKPDKVNIISMKGKEVRSRHIAGKRKNWKKAIVTLPAGKNINIYEGV